MELFKSKESYKKKVDTSNNWKIVLAIMILEWHPFLILLLEFVRKMLKFVLKCVSWPKKCLFIFCIFNLNEKELNQQVRLIQYVQDAISTISIV